MNRTESSFFQKAKGAAKFGIVVLVLAGISWFGVTYSLNVSTPFSVVSGISMEPTLQGGDVVVLQGVPFNQLRPGDIIVFRAPIYNDVQGGCNTQRMLIPCYIIHRIVNITNSSGTELIKTKGDNNAISENGVDCLGSPPSACRPAITQADYVGKVVYKLPLMGVMAFAVSAPYNYIIILILVAAIIMTEYGSRK